MSENFSNIEERVTMNTIVDTPVTDQKYSFDLGVYHSYNEVVGYLNWIAETHFEFVQMSSIGKSFEGRELYFIKV